MIPVMISSNTNRSILCEVSWKCTSLCIYTSYINLISIYKCLVVLEGVTFAVNVVVAPTSTSDAPESLMDAFFTVTVALRVFLTVLPAFLAVTLTGYASMV